MVLVALSGFAAAILFGATRQIFTKRARVTWRLSKPGASEQTASQYYAGVMTGVGIQAIGAILAASLYITSVGSSQDLGGLVNEVCGMLGAVIIGFILVGVGVLTTINSAAAYELDHGDDPEFERRSPRVFRALVGSALGWSIIGLVGLGWALLGASGD